MASGIIAVLDDIAALMDDVALASKMATKKTAGILGDDLAVNAEKATGFLASREIPVLWAITKGSFLNKAIIIPVALALNAFFPSVITLILIAGGIYLAYEGVEKIYESIFHRPKTGAEVIIKQENADSEKAKIRSAVTTDFILSVEIIIIALGTVLEEELPVQILTVCVVGFLATVGVYGVVALIVRMDDAGYRLIKRSEDRGLWGWLGHLLVNALPILINLLGIIGTIALLLVAGGLLNHNIAFFHHLFPEVPTMLKEFCLGFLAGLAALAFVAPLKKIFGKKEASQ